MPSESDKGASFNLMHRDSNMFTLDSKKVQHLAQVQCKSYQPGSHNRARLASRHDNSGTIIGDLTAGQHGQKDSGTSGRLSPTEVMV